MREGQPTDDVRLTTRSQLPAASVRRAAAVGLATLFVVRLTYYVFHDLADGHAGALGARLFEEVTGALLAVPPMLGLLAFARRVPPVRGGGARTAALWAAAFAAFTLVHTAAMIATRALLAPAVGLAGYPLSFGVARFVYEAANDVLPFAVAVALAALAESAFAERARERRAAELERLLLHAELDALRLQLQPHFLFNTLNTISATMYEDVAAADEQLAQLAELLRTSLRTAHTHEVPARDELHLLAQYASLMRARFGDRLTVAVDAADEVLDLLVPSMLLQPLVENAVRHGGAERSGRGRVDVTLRRDGDALELRVHDDGPPDARAAAPALASSGGVGLGATARRLALLHGDAQSMRAGAAPGGGFTVVVRIPARAARARRAAAAR